MSGWVNGQKENKGGQMDGWKEGRMDGWKDRWRKNGQMDGGRETDGRIDRHVKGGGVAHGGKDGGRWVSGFPVSVCPVLRFQPDGVPQACSRKLGRSHPELWCQRILTTSRALIFIGAATGRPA